MRRNPGDNHDVAGVLGSQMRQHGPDYIQRAEVVHFELVPDEIQGLFRSCQFLDGADEGLSIRQTCFVVRVGVGAGGDTLTRTAEEDIYSPECGDSVGSE